MYIHIYYVAMVTAGLTPLYIHLIKIQHSKPWPIGIYVSYTPAYVRKFICDISREPEISQINSSQEGVYLHIYTSWPWFIYYIQCLS